MSVHGIGHVNLRAPAEIIERLRRFYTNIVGLHEGPRPTFRSGSHGYWLYAGTRDVVHLTIASNGDIAPHHQGCFDHLAFDCDDLDGTRGRLDAAGIPYEIDFVGELHQAQLFLIDPVGIGIELTFPESRGNPEQLQIHRHS